MWDGQNIYFRVEYIRTIQKKSARMTGYSTALVCLHFTVCSCSKKYKYICLYYSNVCAVCVYTCVNTHASWAANVVLFFQYPAISAKTFRTGNVANIIDWPMTAGNLQT
jgi:hypothetical protein